MKLDIDTPGDTGKDIGKESLRFAIRASRQGKSDLRFTKDNIFLHFYALQTNLS